jgi:hypothetical protein
MLRLFIPMLAHQEGLILLPLILQRLSPLAEIQLTWFHILLGWDFVALSILILGKLYVIHIYY